LTKLTFLAHFDSLMGHLAYLKIQGAILESVVSLYGFFFFFFFFFILIILIKYINFNYFGFFFFFFFFFIYIFFHIYINLLKFNFKYYFIFLERSSIFFGTFEGNPRTNV
jgi:hypothetical protein